MEVKDVFVVRPTNEEQNDFIITVGKHLATEKHFKNREDAEIYIETPKWDMILAMLAEMLTIYDEEKQNTDKTKKVINENIEDTKKQER